MIRRALVVICWGFGVAAAAAEVPVLAYHDLVRESNGDDYAVTESLFREQMQFLHDQGYHPVSLAAYVHAAQGRETLPAKPVVLTFDDGLTSFRDIALPVLERFGYPAVLSVTTGWLDNREVPERYRGRLLTPEALRSLSRSASLEVLSHTDCLHQGIVSDPQGSLAPAGVSRAYAAGSGYETEPAYRERIRADLQRSVRRLTEVTGKAPTGIAWPYGDSNAILAEEAGRLGLAAQLALDDRVADTRRYPEISRLPVYKVKTLGGFENLLNDRRPRPPVRLLAVSLDALAGQSPAKREAWIKQLASRAVLLRINTVIVDPVAADRRHVFFANPAVPANDDILHRVLFVLRRNAGIHHLYLRLSPPLFTEAAWRELARRHPYDGIVLSDRGSIEHAGALLKEFEYYRPGLRCGTLEALEVAGCQSFRIVNIDAGARLVEPVKSGPRDPPVWYLVRIADTARSAQVLDTLRALRAAGVRDYGIADAALLNDPVTLRDTAIELARYLPSGTGD